MEVSEAFQNLRKRVRNSLCEIESDFVFMPKPDQNHDKNAPKVEQKHDKNDTKTRKKVQIAGRVAINFLIENHEILFNSVGNEIKDKLLDIKGAMNG